ncbi:MAG: MFS transporter [Muribaculaceae bacterium]|nr:MFS transporter [Muribaculaceae bacterium]MDE6786588.1 MFS transporter [Muribaculaceae bacterium]
MTTDSTTSKTVDLATMPLGIRQIFIMIVASLGQFIGQGLATLVGIVIPLIQLVAHPELSSGIQGLMGCISLIGIMVGTVVFGRLSDRYGYLFFFRLCPLIILATSLTCVFIHAVPVLLVCLFLMGFAIGGEYSLDPDYISELMPAKWRTFMVGLAKALASAGSAVVAIICYVMITKSKDPDIWPDLFYITGVIGAIMFVSRLWFAQSPQWLMSRGHTAEAQKAVEKFLGPNVRMISDVAAATSSKPQAKPESMGAFIKEHLRKIILTGVPWACEGLGVYGIGIFLPVLIMSFKIDSLPATAPEIEHITHSVGLTFVLTLVMMLGFGLGLYLLKKENHVKMQIVGFWGSAIGLGLLMAAYLCHWPSWVAIAGFVIFELFLNAGPHLITFILPSQVYAIENRGTGTGIAAGIGKAGAVAGAFIIPVLLKSGGPTTVMIVSIAVMAAGALITYFAKPKSSK